MSHPQLLKEIAVTAFVILKYLLCHQIFQPPEENGKDHKLAERFPTSSASLHAEAQYLKTQKNLSREGSQLKR
jgi:hypothetical protein